MSFNLSKSNLDNLHPNMKYIILQALLIFLNEIPLGLIYGNYRVYAEIFASLKYI